MFIEIHRRGRGGREGEGGGGGQWREAIGVGIKGFGAGRFAFSIWRMLPPPSRISGPCKPREKPLLPAWYRLIYSRKVAIVDIKPATPTFIPVDTRYACVYICVCVARWVVSVNALYTSFNIRQRYFNPSLHPLYFVSRTNRSVYWPKWLRTKVNNLRRSFTIGRKLEISLKRGWSIWKTHRGGNVEIMWKSKRPLSGVGSGKMEDRVRRE